jgi:hypothetical protein
VNSALIDRAAAVARLLAATCLLLAPGLALSYCLFPRRALDLLERAYLGALSSLSLLTLFGVALLEGKGGLRPWLLASYGLACTAACMVGAAVSRLRRGHGREGRAGPGIALRGTRIWVHGTRSYIPAPFVARLYRAPTRARRRPHRRGGTRRPYHPPRMGYSAVRSLFLLATAALTLLAYRAFAMHPPPGGPEAAFSVPGDRLVEMQAALRQGGRLAIPFEIENLSPYDASYRVEAWAPMQAGAVGSVAVAVEHMVVAAGATGCGELQISLSAGGDDAPVDLYLFPAKAAMPLAHLRLWPAG